LEEKRAATKGPLRTRLEGESGDEGAAGAYASKNTGFRVTRPASGVVEEAKAEAAAKAVPRRQGVCFNVKTGILGEGEVLTQADGC
jgi:hypothetical protein